MKLGKALAVFGLFAGAACVTAGTDEAPKGGVDVTFQPSAATLGTPFVTPDGWTVTVHRFVLRVAANDVTRIDGKDAGDATGGGPGPVGLFAPDAGCHLFLYGATAGDDAIVNLVMPELFVGDDVGQYLLPPCGLDAETVTRFSEPGEDSGDLELPDLLLEADAVKGTQHITVSLVVTGEEAVSANMTTVGIHANAGVPLVFPLRAEAMFVAFDPLSVGFDEVALADSNGDGVVTGAELAATTRQCVTTGPSSNDDGGSDGGSDDDDDSGCDGLLFDLMRYNASDIFGGASPL